MRGVFAEIERNLISQRVKPGMANTKVKGMEKYDAEETIAPLTEFLKYETEKTWEKTLERGERENRKKRLEEIR